MYPTPEEGGEDGISGFNARTVSKIIIGCLLVAGVINAVAKSLTKDPPRRMASAGLMSRTVSNNNRAVEDALDAFPLDPNESLNFDGDGIGNNADPDDDNDTVEDALDAFPLDPNESLNTDGDGIGNNADPDDDNDTVEDRSGCLPARS